MSKIAFLFLIASSVFFLSLSSASATPGALRGRLPSGQAYRVDGGGNQIVDYIAELEVTNESLQRRIRGLLGEVEKLRSRPGSSQPLRERELVSGAPLANTAVKTAPVASPKLAECPTASCGERECEVFITEVQDRGARMLQARERTVSILQQQKNLCDEHLQSVQASMAMGRKGATKTATAYQEAMQQIASLKALLRQRNSEIQGANGSLLTVNDRLTSLQSERKELLDAQAALHSKVQRLEQEIRKSVEAKSAVTRVALIEKSQAPKASLRQQAIPQMEKRSATISDATRKKAKDLFMSVIRLRNKRDKFFSAYNSSTLSIQKRALRTKKGQLPEQLLGMVKSTGNIRQLSQIVQEGKRMEKLALQDIALIKRMVNR